MPQPDDFLDIFDDDEHFGAIMKHLLIAHFEESFNGIMITEAGPGYPIVYVNPAFCDMTGYGPHELTGKSPAVLQGPRTDRWVLDQLGEDIRAGKVFHGRTVNYRKNEEEFMMEWKIIPIRNAQETITHYLAIQRDTGPPAP